MQSCAGLCEWWAWHMVRMVATCSWGAGQKTRKGAFPSAAIPASGIHPSCKTDCAHQGEFEVDENVSSFATCLRLLEAAGTGFARSCSTQVHPNANQTQCSHHPVRLERRTCPLAEGTSPQKDGNGRCPFESTSPNRGYRSPTKTAPS